MLLLPLTGCMESNDTSDNNEFELENAVNNFFNSITNKEYRKICEYMTYNFDFENNTIILANETELDECIEIEKNADEGDSWEYKNIISNYTEKNLDYRASNNSGFVYSVNVNYEECIREDEFEPWDCFEYDWSMNWVKINDQWLLYIEWPTGPIATFFVEKNSGGKWHVEVIKVSKQEDLAGFSYFLKDETGSTHVGGNGFGEVAMQIVGGEEHGIEVSYQGDDEQLQSRSNNVSADDGTDYPVNFADNDRDGKLSAGDQFTVYGQGNSANGPAESGWKLDIQFDASGDIIGSAKLLGN